MVYSKCLLCPRHCGVDREAGIPGYCGETSGLRIAFAGIHRGEEPPVTGTGGSGTIFISGCNLGCAFCQNFQISDRKSALGKIVEMDEFSRICLALQEKGAQNINIVTGSHAAPAIVRGIDIARKNGLFLPLLWNSSGYEGMQTLEILEKYVDVYLPDLKTLDPVFARKFFNAPDYPDHAMAAIKKMIEQRELRFKGDAIVSGVMIRHLVIPGYIENTRHVLRWFSENCEKALISIMTQYTPVYNRTNSKIPARHITHDEYTSVLAMLDEFNINNGFCQELVTGSGWLPDFTRPNPFSSGLSVPVWSCQYD